MLRNILIGISAAVLMSVSMAADAADYVSQVYACGANSIIITLQSGKSLWVYAPDAGSTMMDRIYAMSLELLASGKQIGYYNSLGTGNSTCGLSGLQEISVMTATNSN